LAVQVLARVDDAAAAQQEVVEHGSFHFTKPGWCEASGTRDASWARRS
jgi:hypothetical protein